ncbi:DUF4286 family protein [Chloroflexota bacterium]
MIHIVGVKCRPDQEEKFSKWFNEKHVLDLLKFKGLRRATRYQLLYRDGKNPVTPDMEYPIYLGVYEFDNQQDFEAYEASPELAEAHKNLLETWAKDPFERVWRVQYRALKTWENR